MRRSTFLKIIGLLCGLPIMAQAAAMQSSSYVIQSDSINFGGSLGSSTSYVLDDTIGEIATGLSNSASYYMSAGFRQMQETSISITSAADVSMDSINGLTGGISTSSATWTVITDNPAGYTLTVQSNTSPSLKSAGGAGFADYAPVSTPSFAFSILATESAFGFSPEGVDIASVYKDNGSACSTGSSDTADACWDGFSVTPKTVAERLSGNHPAGTATTLKFWAESGSSHIQDSGAYSATITVTAAQL